MRLVALGVGIVVLLAFTAVLVNLGGSEFGAVDSVSPSPNYPTPTSTLTPTAHPSPSPTLKPTLKPTVAPAVTPGPTGMLPDDVKINYQECSRTYDQTINITQITLQIQVISDLTTRRTFLLYEKNFYLKENGQMLSEMDSNSTLEIILNEDRQTATAIAFSVKGNYIGNAFELDYFNPPDILFFWKKL